MKILAVSDQVDDSLYSPNVQRRFGDVSLVIGCGDLPYHYLEYLGCSLNVPLFYVPGNHDPLYRPRVMGSSAEGYGNIDGCVVAAQGLVLAGLGGSVRYKPTGANQYTQGQMVQRVRKLMLRILWKRLFRRWALDIAVAHSPPFGIHDDDDLAHTGFHAFVELIRWFRPRYFLHGHTLFYKTNLVSPMTEVGRTRVINVYPYRLIDIESAG